GQRHPPRTASGRDTTASPNRTGRADPRVTRFRGFRGITEQSSGDRGRGTLSSQDTPTGDPCRRISPSTDWLIHQFSYCKWLSSLRRDRRSGCAEWVAIATHSAHPDLLESRLT